MQLAFATDDICTDVVRRKPIDELRCRRMAIDPACMRDSVLHAQPLREQQHGKQQCGEAAASDIGSHAVAWHCAAPGCMCNEGESGWFHV